MGEFYEFNKRNFLKLVIISVPVSAVISNVLRLFIPDVNVILLIMMIITIIFLILTQDISIKHISKIVLAVLFSIVILQVTEIYIIVYIKKTGETIDILKNSPLLSFYVSLPERLMQYLILWFTYSIRLDYISVEFNKNQKRIFVIFLSVAFLYYCIFGRLLLTDMINIRGVTLILLTSVPVLVVWVYYCYAYTKNRRNIIRKKYSEILEKALNYRKIKLKMD